MLVIACWNTLSSAGILQAALAWWLSIVSRKPLYFGRQHTSALSNLHFLDQDSSQYLLTCVRVHNEGSIRKFIRKFKNILLSRILASYLRSMRSPGPIHEVLTYLLGQGLRWESELSQNSAWYLFRDDSSKILHSVLRKVTLLESNLQYHILKLTRQSRPPKIHGHSCSWRTSPINLHWISYQPNRNHGLNVALK